MDDDDGVSPSPILRLPLDPVCGMEVNPIHPPAQSEWSGRIYCFCCEQCQRLFEHNPAHYADPPHDEAASRAVQGKR